MSFKPQNFQRTFCAMFGIKFRITGNVLLKCGLLHLKFLLKTARSKKCFPLTKLEQRIVDGQRKTPYNRRLAQWRVTWLIEHSTSHQLLWCIDSFELRNPLLRKAANRYTKFYSKHCAKSSLKILGFKGQKSPCFFLESRQIF